MLRVLVVDDHAVVRAGLNRIINDAPGMRVSAEAGDAAEALDKLQAGSVDVVVLDLDLPGRGGLDLIGDIKQLYPKLPILILSFHAETAFAVPALQAGADGYLVKDSSTEALVEAIDKVVSGGKFVTASVAEQLATAVGTEANRPRHTVLSGRECEVFRLIGSGLSVSQIAAKLGLSVKTISTYRARVLEKMELQNNAQLIHYAIKQQLVELT
jgi:two-component system invasion response regulator UvrY